jgi:hypothetical protein
MKWQGQLAKQHADEMSIGQNGKLMKCQLDEMTRWQEAMKVQLDKTLFGQKAM